MDVTGPCGHAGCSEIPLRPAKYPGKGLGEMRWMCIIDRLASNLSLPSQTQIAIAAPA